MTICLDVIEKYFCDHHCQVILPVSALHIFFFFEHNGILSIPQWGLNYKSNREKKSYAISCS